MGQYEALHEQIRNRIVGGLHLGQLRAGDRLPSIRQLSRDMAADHRAVARVYRTLAEEGLVVVRGRSGVYVAEPERIGGEILGETARWLAEVLVEGWRRRISVPELSGFVHRYTARRIRCACVESTIDHLRVLEHELSRDFGLDAHPVPLGSLSDDDGEPEALRDAELLVTTAFHAPEVRRLGERLGKPVVVVRVDPQIVRALERRVEEGGLTAIAVDPAFEPRLRALGSGEHADRIRVLRADDRGAVAALDPEEPVLVTRAAHERLGSIPAPLLAPLSPSLDPASARELALLLVQLNVEAG